jgi:pyruvate kinase
LEDSPLSPLISQLEQLRAQMLAFEAAHLSSDVHPQHLPGARNLLHYVALRQHDVRDLQHQLAFLGLSSLGRVESHVLPTLLAVLHQLSPTSPSPSPADWAQGPNCLHQNAEALLGPEPSGRRVRIAVTMPPEAATQDRLVHRLLAAGMNVMRINCAHDGPEAWTAMIARLRQAQRDTGLSCRIEMDLAGPKLRTGPLSAGTPVQHVRPLRDELGRMLAPARLWLCDAANTSAPPASAAAILPFPTAWLNNLEPGQLLHCQDSRGAQRTFEVTERTATGLWAATSQSCYLIPGLPFAAPPHGTATLGDFPGKPPKLLLKTGDTLLLTRSLAPGTPAANGQPARIGISLPEFFAGVQPGDPIWFDDGVLGGRIESVTPEEALVRISFSRPAGEKLGAEKGVNIPESELPLPALTDEDRAVLPFIVKHADLVAYSFVRDPADLRLLRAELAALGRPDLGILLKIETRQAFDNLPALLIEAMRSSAAGVMIARGDLAIECGYERLAEIQEEILWLSEAAHLPVVWATQVLESLAKTGLPSRSEITDAAMGERAECVMLNKGPYIVEAVETLDGILSRMQSHQTKKTAMLRKLQVAAAFRP